MVDTVHLGCDHNQPQQTIDAARKAYVAMIEQAGGIQKDLEDQNGQG